MEKTADTVVISGISGAFPSSENVEELKNNLYNKVNLTQRIPDNWHESLPEVPIMMGKLKDKTRFDAGFFGVSSNASNTMDPMGRMLLEKTYEAILDSGTNPTELHGSRTGVIICLMHSDTEQHWANELKNSNSGLQNSMKTGLARRIAYHFKFVGPTFTVDSACSSSIYSIEHAVRLIKNGVIDNAIIGGCNFILNPLVTLQFTGLGALSLEAMCRPFDTDGTGYVRGETLVTIFLQRSQNARRIYAEVVNVNSNCDGFKDQSITFPSQEGQSELLRDFYKGCGVDPRQIAYVEAHGTGTPAGDPVELNSIESVFCKDRSTPLLIGSMKANTGHAEPASGLNSIIKVILMMEKGSIVPTINHKHIRKNINGLVEGRLKVVTEEITLPSDKPMIGVNSFGFGGANGHLLLKANTKSNSYQKETNIPLVICASSRTRNGIASFLEKSIENANNLEYICLLHSIFRCSSPGNDFRGYVILNGSKLHRKSINCTGSRRSLSIVFGRPNKNWSNSQNDLQKLPIFRDYIKKIESQCKSLDLPITITNLLNNTKEANDYPLMRAVLIQIGLYHVLTTLNVKIDPSKLHGRSFGQIAVAYIKNELSLEETMLTAFFSSAIVDNDYNTIKNDTNNNNNNLMVLEKLPNPVKNKLNKWLLSMQSYLSDENIDEEVVLQIGEEIAVNLDSKVHMNLCGNGTVLSLLESLGRLYEYGYDVDLLKLYPAVTFPVSRGTPMISPQIKWKHDKEWFVMGYQPESDCEYYHRMVTVNLREKEWEHLKGHVIDGRILLPAAAYILIAWDTLAAMKGKPKFNMEYITIKNPKFLRTIPLDEDRPTELTILLQKSTGKYTIKEDGNVVGTGEIFETEHSTLLTEIGPFEETKSGYFALNIKDVYKELTIRNYDYCDMFKSIVSCNSEVTHAHFEWKKNYFIPFLDGMFQFPLLEVDTRKLRVPVGVDRINIDVQNQLKITENVVPVEYHPKSGILRSKYVEFRGSQANSISKRKQASHPVVKSYQFVSHDCELNQLFALNVIIQLVIENTTSLKLKIIETLDHQVEPLCNDIVDILKTEPLVQSDIKLLTNEFVQFDGKFHKIQTLIGETECQLIITSNLSKSNRFLDQMLKATSNYGFILTREHLNASINYSNLTTVTVIKMENEKFVLLRKHQTEKQQTVVDITNSVESFDWLTELQQNLNGDHKIIILSKGQPLCGILGFVNCLKREMGTENLQCVFLYDDDKLSNEVINEQLKQGLLFNVWKNNQWGTYRYLPIDEHQLIECEYRYISVTKPGDISSAKWLQGPEITDAEKENIVYVHFAAINNKDIMISKGLLPTDLIKGNTEHSYNPGFEFAGVDANNNRVMGLVKHSALSNIVIANPQTLWRIPDHWSLQDAATVPLVYCTVLYSLIMVAKVKKGQTILIHSGSGGVGQAAINIALFCGLKVFTTVGSDKKREYIKRKFPQIQDNQIGFSRDSSFEQLILTQTKGLGVDVVLNSQSEDNFYASVCCLAKRGHFVEIGRQNMDNDNKLSEEIFTKSAVFHGIDIETFLNNDKNLKIVSYLLKEAVDKGFVKPLEKHTFEEHHIQDAFNLMSTGQHVGKIIVKINQPSLVDKIMSVRRYSCNPNGSYILIGGLGGFGMELANWLVTRGCRKLVLTSRVGVTNGYQDMRIRCWRANGVQVEILTSDVTTNNGCKNILEHANSMGPITSIFNLAVVLRDSLIENQTVDKFRISFAPKVMATIILDSLSRTLCPQLKDFVIFSSVVSGWGNTGQSNYGMANSVMERICEQRRKDDLPGLAIQWGAIGNVGILMEKEDAPKIVGGTALQSITSCLKVLDRVLRRDEIIFTSMLIAEKKDSKNEEVTVKDVVAQILGIRNIKTVGNTLTLPQLGLDSVMVVEVKEKLERMFGIYLTLQEIRKLTFDDLEKLQESKE